jgi:hypothetical protein
MSEKSFNGPESVSPLSGRLDSAIDPASLWRGRGMPRTLTVALSVHAPRLVRRAFDRYSETIEESLLDDLRLLSSEVVTNAVQHSGRPQGDPIRVDITTTHQLIRVGVTDQGQRTEAVGPRSRAPASGLQYVELLSDRWSSGPANSFHVWFEIDIQTNGLLTRKQPQPTKHETASD